MKICDNCSRIVENLVEERLHMSLKNGFWYSVYVELCIPCKDRLYEIEREHREYAILKSHREFLNGMRENEAVRRREIHSTIS
jgi:hypothetical protein